MPPSGYMGREKRAVVGKLPRKAGRSMPTLSDTVLNYRPKPAGGNTSSDSTSARYYGKFGQVRTSWNTGSGWLVSRSETVVDPTVAGFPKDRKPMEPESSKAYVARLNLRLGCRP